MGKQHTDQWNAVNFLRPCNTERQEQLIAKGIPADQIAFIHDNDSDKEKKRLSIRVNSGKIRVLIGSTSKMGAGLNVQKRLIALHHVDCPWRPRDIEQREGRILRQGNENERYISIVMLPRVHSTAITGRHLKTNRSLSRRP